uniref:Uncharacterized protein n=1 Tax=Photinus pyralis TaxID=7054 RepID=A0A1Y1MXX9_PHOPY
MSLSSLCFIFRRIILILHSNMTLVFEYALTKYNHYNKSLAERVHRCECAATAGSNVSYIVFDYVIHSLFAIQDIVLESVPVIDGHRQRVTIVQEEVIQLPPTVVEFNFVPAGEGSSKLIYRYQPRSLQTLSGAAVLNKFKYRSFVPENIYGYIYMPKRILYFLKQLWRARQLKIIWRTEIHEALTNKEICNITSIRTLKSRYPTTVE